MECYSNNNEIQMITRKHFENVHSIRLENLKEMNKLLDAFDH
jgi:hypothetical protein